MKDFFRKFDIEYYCIQICIIIGFVFFMAILFKAL